MTQKSVNLKHSLVLDVMPAIRSKVWWAQQNLPKEKSV
jgi:hypothetical protein